MKRPHPKLKKKGFALQGNFITYMMIGILIAMMLLFLLTSISSFNKRQRQIMIDQLETDIKSMVDEVEFGSLEQGRFRVPNDVEMICFFDIHQDKKDSILKSPIIAKYPLIKESLHANERMNMFLLSGKGVLDKRYVGDLCFDDYPYYDCVSPDQNWLEMDFEGGSTCTLIASELRKCLDVTPFLDPAGLPAKKLLTAVDIFSDDLYLSLPDGLTFTDLPDENEICLGAVEPPEGMTDDQKDAIVSEVYEIWPHEAPVPSFDTDASLRANFISAMLPPKITEDKVKLLKWDGLNGNWDTIGLAQQSVELDEEHVTETEVTSHGLYAVFGPSPPKAIIKINNNDPSNPDYVDKDALVNFESASTDADGDIVSYEWDFGDSTTGNVQTIPHTYSEYGSFEVTLTVEDSTGYRSVASAQINVINPNNKKGITDGIILLPRGSPDIDEDGILQLMPLMAPNDWENDPLIPLIIYSGNLNAADLQDLKDEYPPDIVYNFGLDIGGNEDTLASLPRGPDQVTKYLDFWTNGGAFDEVVILSSTASADLRIRAAKFATMLNIPLIHESNPVLPALNGKDAFIFGTVNNNVQTVIDKGTFKTIDEAPEVSEDLYSIVIPPDAIS